MTHDRTDAVADRSGADDTAERSFERDAFHPGVARLDRYLSSTDLDAPAGLVEDIDRRLATRPQSTPARRLSSAARAGDTVAILRTLRQALAMALGAGRVRPMMRAQAAAVLVFVLAASGVSSVAGLVGVQAGVEVAGTIVRDVVSAHDGLVARQRDGSSAADRDRNGVVAGRAATGQPSKGKKVKSAKSRVEAPSKGKKDRKADRRAKPPKAGKDKQRRDQLDTKPGTRHDERLKRPSKGRKDASRKDWRERMPWVKDADRPKWLSKDKHRDRSQKGDRDKRHKDDRDKRHKDDRDKRHKDDKDKRDKKDKAENGKGKKGKRHTR